MEFDVMVKIPAFADDAQQARERVQPYLKDMRVQYEITGVSPAGQAAPIDMVLHCPACHVQHIDAPDTEPCKQGCQYARDIAMPEHTCGAGCMYLLPESPRWTNPPHRSHLCGNCGHIWRPADVPTNGVAATKTKGKRDTP
jgi:hypothetical protein